MDSHPALVANTVAAHLETRFTTLPRSIVPGKTLELGAAGEMTIAELVHEHYAGRTGHVAMIDGERSVTYGELEGEVALLSRYIQARLGKDRVRAMARRGEEKRRAVERAAAEREKKNEQAQTDEAQQLPRSVDGGGGRARAWANVRDARENVQRQAQRAALAQAAIEMGSAGGAGGEGVEGGVVEPYPVYPPAADPDVNEWKETPIIALYLPKSIEYLVAHLAAWEVGCAVIILETNYTPSLLTDLIEDTGSPLVRVYAIVKRRLSDADWLGAVLIKLS